MNVPKSPNFLPPAQVSLNSHLLLAKAKLVQEEEKPQGTFLPWTHHGLIHPNLSHRKINGVGVGHKLLIASISHCYHQQKHRCSPTKTERGKKLIDKGIMPKTTQIYWYHSFLGVQYLRKSHITPNASKHNFV